MNGKKMLGKRLPERVHASSSWPLGFSLSLRKTRQIYYISDVGDLAVGNLE
jgi:hypothetical protein